MERVGERGGEGIEVFLPIGDREGLGVFISLDITTATPVIAAVARNPDKTKPSIIYF